MREYAKLAPTFWTGTTGRALRRRGSDAVIVALYLVSSPHSNMLGLFYQPLMYMAHETGLGIEGASKGLQACIACGFCSYDEDTEMVFVHEMAAWQIAGELSSGDKRCKGIQKDYDALPNCPFLGAWFDRYEKPFNLSTRRDFAPDENEGASQAPSKPHRSQEQEQEQESSEAIASAVAPPSAPPPAIGNPAPTPMTAKDRLWALGVALLGERGRSFLGKAVATYGEPAVLEVLHACNAEQPGEPKAWITKALEARAKQPAKANGNHGQQTMDDLLKRDPRPEWATAAGFSNIFEAESAGCGPGNFEQFRNGARVAA